MGEEFHLKATSVLKFCGYGQLYHVYPMDPKNKGGDVLILFCQEFGVIKKLTFNVSKEQCMKGTELMKQV